MRASRHRAQAVLPIVKPPQKKQISSMTTFVCLLSPDAGASFAERVVSGLDAAFPQHQFLAAEAEAAGFENTFIAVHGNAGSGDEPGTITLPFKVDVGNVNEAFQSILRDLKGWKQSELPALPAFSPPSVEPHSRPKVCLPRYRSLIEPVIFRHRRTSMR